MNVKEPQYFIQGERGFRYRGKYKTISWINKYEFLLMQDTLLLSSDSFNMDFLVTKKFLKNLF